MTNAIAARSFVKPDAASSATFTKGQRDAAYHAQVERYVAWARELLDATAAVIDTPMI